jgi:predicted Zn-dependent protease
VQRLVAHELGHVLGIGRHSEDPRDLMWRTDPSRSTPGPRDAATVLVLYHTVAGLVP